MTVSQPSDPLEAAVRQRWQTVFGEPLPITGGLELAIGILREIEDKAASEMDQSSNT